MCSNQGFEAGLHQSRLRLIINQPQCHRKSDMILYLNNHVVELLLKRGKKIVHSDILIIRL